MSTTTHPMTVEEFRKLPEEKGEVYHELHHGELVALTRPKPRHILIQHNLYDLLKRIAPAKGFVALEFPFRALPEWDYRVSDVCYIAPERWLNLDLDEDLRGAPDLVIEVLSPSNTFFEILDKEKVCLENGAREFWVVDPERRQVKITTPDGITVTYHSGQAITLRLFQDSEISVEDIFLGSLGDH